MVEHQLVVTSIPTYILNFNHSSLFAFIHASIHNNLSAGAQNVTGAYIIMLVYRRLLMLQNVTGAYIIMLVYRRLLTTRLYGKAAV